MSQQMCTVRSHPKQSKKEKEEEQCIRDKIKKNYTKSGASISRSDGVRKPASRFQHQTFLIFGNSSRL
jgi:hypothetical protein